MPPSRRLSGATRLDGGDLTLVKGDALQGWQSADLTGCLPYENKENSVRSAVPSQVASPGSPQTQIDRDCATCQIVCEADHRIANHLSFLASFVRLSARELREGALGEQPEIQILLSRISSQIETVSRLHRALASEPGAAPDLGLSLRELCASLDLALVGRASLIQNLPAGHHVGPDQILPITHIVAEAVTNAIKYAHPRDGRCIIRVGCGVTEDGRPWVEVADNGGPSSNAFDPNTAGGLGFRLMHALAKQMKAVLNFKTTDSGLCVSLALPAETGEASASQAAKDSSGQAAAVQ